MRRVTRNGVIAVAAASGAMAVAMPAYAAGVAGADGAAAGSPGVVSGNTVQLPVRVPVNLCGNTVDVVGLLNPAAGNSCVAEDTGAPARSGGAATGGGARAEGDGTDSPGVLSGNGLRLPVHLPVNLSGNSVNVVGVGDASGGNESVNGPGDLPDAPAPAPDRPTEPSAPPKHTPAGPPPAAPSAPGTTLAHTGTDQLLPTALGSTALILMGATVYRRARRGARG